MDREQVYEAVLRHVYASNAAGDVYRDVAAEVLGIEPEAVTDFQRMEVKRLAWAFLLDGMRPTEPLQPLAPFCHWCSTRHSGSRKGPDGKFCPGPLREPEPRWT